MFKIYRSIIIAAGLALSTSFAWPQSQGATDLGQTQEQTEAAEDWTADQERPAQQLPIPVPVQIIEDDESADARKARENIGDEREKNDLIAQQSMARSTEAMNQATQSMKWSSWLSAGLVFVGTILLLWTLCLTRQANKSAVKAAKAATDSVDITRMMGERQSRAYISVEPQGIEALMSPQGMAIASVGIRNVGNVPASRLAWKIKAEFDSDNRRIEFPVDEGETEGDNALPPRTVMVQGSPEISAASLIKQNPSMFLYVWGLVLYVDGFNEKEVRYIRFCHRYNCVNFAQGKVSPDFGRFHRYGNYTD